jgi:DNA-binding CsgD family transcriptional regulator
MKQSENEKAIAGKVAEIAKTADEYPGIIIIHNIQEEFNKTEFMSTRGRKILGLSTRDVSELGADYFTRFFNIEDARDYNPKMLEMVKKNNLDTVYSFFQQVRPAIDQPYAWYHSSTKLLMRDSKGMPLLAITMAVPIDPKHHITNKVSRLLEENNFLRLHITEFASLTKREKEILVQLARGKTSAYIAKNFHITVDTIKTHRKNIYQKLKIKTAYEISEYARAFDLI